jgi:hypothetical protein
MSKQEKTYLLFVYGTFGDTEEDVQLFIEMMGEQFFDLSSDGYMPYAIGPYHGIYKFKSIIDYSDIKERIDDTWSNMSHTYFLVETSENLSYKVGDSGEDPFSDNTEGKQTKSSDKDGDVIHDYEKIIEFIENIPKDDVNTDFDFFRLIIDNVNISEDDDEDEEISLILKKNKKNKIITIDEVLEKILLNGIDSINSEEKQTLDNYANGQ